MAMFQEAIPSLTMSGTPEEEIIKLKRCIYNLCEELDYTLRPYDSQIQKLKDTIAAQQKIISQLEDAVQQRDEYSFAKQIGTIYMQAGIGVNGLHCDADDTSGGVHTFIKGCLEWDGESGYEIDLSTVRYGNYINKFIVKGGKLTLNEIHPSNPVKEPTNIANSIMAYSGGYYEFGDFIVVHFVFDLGGSFAANTSQILCTFPEADTFSTMACGYQGSTSVPGRLNANIKANGELSFWHENAITGGTYAVNGIYHKAYT
ncbi:MAG: hypothetical protein IJS22_03450 [Lachnospiraceae bacterium]|nr:hypothetical protein [Lachnospiraceae bacterium]